MSYDKLFVQFIVSVYSYTFQSIVYLFVPAAAVSLRSEESICLTAAALIGNLVYLGRMRF